MPYLKVDEVEKALKAATKPPVVQLIPLPNPTWEGNQCHAIKIANGSGVSRPGVFFLGGVHGNEWGSSDILINFIEQLEQAYFNNTPLSFGARTFSAVDLKTIVDTLDIVVFPQANPDGRAWSMSTDPAWRMNRRTAPWPNSTACPGVDINRNFDFLWDFAKHFDTKNAEIHNSLDPCVLTGAKGGAYVGPGTAFSEPESKNVRSIFDNFPNIRFFVDLHSPGESIRYSWGDDENQDASQWLDPNMNFHNSMYDGKRGVKGDATYMEYMPPNDLSTLLSLAKDFQDGIKAFRGRVYGIKPLYDLYPTAGGSVDYAYSRHFVDPSKEKVISYALEWGSEANPDKHHPPFPEMQDIISEITCGLLAFCLKICEMEEAMAWKLTGNSSTVPATDFLGTIDNQPLAIKTNGSERLHIAADGDIGIGTPTPRAKLDVAEGAIVSGVVIGANVAGGNYQYAYETLGAAPGKNLRLQSPNLIIFHTGNPPTDKLVITPTGDVGIGTPNPRAKLDVAGGAIVSGVVIGANVAGGNYQYAYETLGAAPGLNLRLQSPNSIIFHTGNPPTEKLVITPTGNVGIGTPQPGARLEVVTTSPTDSGLIARSSGGGAAVFAGNSAGGPAVVGTCGTPGSALAAVIGQNLGDAAGVVGLATLTSPTSFGVLGVVGPTFTQVTQVVAQSTGGIGVVGSSLTGDGVGGVTHGATGSCHGVEGLQANPNSTGAGVFGHTVSANGVAVQGENSASGGHAGLFVGNVAVLGTLTASFKAFRIDHPLDPSGKYLNHSSIESPDMMNVYNGNITTDRSGKAVVVLPKYFEALNRDFKYQLTVIGEFAQAVVSQEIKDNHFAIRTDRGNVKVSWQVTGVRKDPYAEAHRIVVEEKKTKTERGRYLHPELYPTKSTKPDAKRPIGWIPGMFGQQEDISSISKSYLSVFPSDTRGGKAPQNVSKSRATPKAPRKPVTRR